MKKLLLITILILAAFLRLYRLNDIPPGVNRDEASIGVTAYSLMTTGKDEYGRAFPLSFESFGDWKLPLYIYTTIPFVKLFGLSELAVRLPSAIAGIMSVAAIYYLAQILFASEFIALAASLSLALMPWHIHISRVESEAIVAVLLTLVGSIHFLQSVKSKSIGKLISSAVLFSATYYTYHGSHVSTSLLLIGLFFIYRKEVMRIPRWWIAAGTGIILVLVILSVTFSADRTKISGISIFGDPTVVHTKIELPRLEHNNPNGLIARLVHNKATFAVMTVVQNYLKSYSPEFLFIKGGGNSAHNIQGYGNLHAIEAPLLLFGLVWLISLFKKREAKFVLWWIAIGAVAAAITKDAPHSNRMLAVTPSLAIATGSGIYFSTQLAARKLHKIIIVLLLIGYSFVLLPYLDLYFVHFAKTEAANWGYAYKKLVPILFSEEYKNSPVVMTRPETSPYIYLLFYSGYPPSEYQRETKRYPISNDGFTDVEEFGRFTFRPIVWEKDIQRPKTVLVARPDDVPDSYNKYRRHIITLPDGSAYWYLLTTP